MSNEIIPVAEAIIARKENINTIMQSGPQSYETNLLSCQRCNDAGARLLEESRRGMTDDLDQKIAAYIEKTRRTQRAMNERRAPITKLFDRVRTEFTSLENAIDPAKEGTVAYQLQQQRNAYAAKKRAEEEARRKARMAEEEARRAKESYRAAVEEDYRKTFNNRITKAIDELTTLNNTATLESYTATFDTISAYTTTLPADWCPPSGVVKPYNLTVEEAKEIRTATLAKLLPEFREQYRFEVEDYRNDILDKLPSKKSELERMAEADAAEAARIKADMARREAEETARKEQERRKAEEEARRKAELDKSNAEMAGLFGMAKAETTYTPKAKVNKKIEITDPQAFLPILSMWWQRVGCTMTVEELSKMFKKQITFCEKLADKEEVYVEGVGISYVDEVKAK